MPRERFWTSGPNAAHWLRADSTAGRARPSPIPLRASIVATALSPMSSHFFHAASSAAVEWVVGVGGFEIGHAFCFIAEHADQRVLGPDVSHLAEHPDHFNAKFTIVGLVKQSQKIRTGGRANFHQRKMRFPLCPRIASLRKVWQQPALAIRTSYRRARSESVREFHDDPDSALLPAPATCGSFCIKSCSAFAARSADKVAGEVILERYRLNVLRIADAKARCPGSSPCIPPRLRASRPHPFSHRPI